MADKATIIAGLTELFGDKVNTSEAAIIGAQFSELIYERAYARVRKH